MNRPAHRHRGRCQTSMRVSRKVPSENGPVHRLLSAGIDFFSFFFFFFFFFFEEASVLQKYFFFLLFFFCFLFFFFFAFSLFRFFAFSFFFFLLTRQRRRKEEAVQKKQFKSHKSTKAHKPASATGSSKVKVVHKRDRVSSRDRPVVCLGGPEFEERTRKSVQPHTHAHAPARPHAYTPSHEERLRHARARE